MPKKTEQLPAAQRFARNVRARMAELGMTQDRLGDKIGVSRHNVSRMLSTPTEPALGRAEEIAKALGCTVDDLLE